PLQSPRPPLYFGGSSDAGIDVAVDTVDKYLTWGEPPQQVAEKVNRVKAAASQRGRKLSFGIRLHVIVRETNADAWAAADDLIERLPLVRTLRIPRAEGLIPWIVPLAIVLAWQAASSAGLVPARVLPAPSDVVLAGWKLLRSGELERNIWVSFWRASTGFVIG